MKNQHRYKKQKKQKTNTQICIKKPVITQI